MAQWLRSLAALAEDPGSVPAPTWRLATVCNSSSRGDQMPSSGLFDHFMHMCTYIYACIHTYIYKTKINKIFFFMLLGGGGHMPLIPAEAEAGGSL